jgi:hypothetical protein
MGHKVRLHKAGLGFIPLLERADGNLLLEQRSRARGGETMLTSFALRGKQLASALNRDVKVFMPLQGFYQGRKKGDESFGTDAVGGVPGQKERVLGFRSILARAGALRCGLPLFLMIEEPHRVLTIVSSRCRKSIEQLALLLDSRCLTILRDHNLK